ncbi:IS1595 family transposase [Dongia sp.]|uniref:IS1595 family transposase n=1 Tax=Dongia sp. TaxID=1977262 RepID=UPI003752C109
MKYTFKEFQAEYPDDGACLDRIFTIQFGSHEIICPTCGVHGKFNRIAKRRAYACSHCGHHVYPCVGTIFEKSRTPLTNWFFAMYLMTSTRHGVAAKELERQIGCTYKTAWRMAHELRKLMAAASDQTLLSGHIEVDETYVGGKQTQDDRRIEGSNKTIVFGMYERDRDIMRTGTVYSASQADLVPIIQNHVKVGSTISSDENQAYAKLDTSYRHETVTHSAGEYARGKHHVNNLESHWGQLKRSIRGTHIHVSSQHLWKYAAEFAYRWNMRKSHEAMFNRLIASFSLPRPADY